MAIDKDDFEPFFDEHAQQHPWNPAVSDFPEHEHSGEERNSWETQNPPVSDDSNDNFYAPDPDADNENLESGSNVEELPAYDPYSQHPKPLPDGAGNATAGTDEPRLSLQSHFSKLSLEESTPLSQVHMLPDNNQIFLPTLLVHPSTWVAKPDK
jgi:hypothetical protein